MKRPVVEVVWDGVFHSYAKSILIAKEHVGGRLSRVEMKGQQAVSGCHSEERLR